MAAAAGASGGPPEDAPIRIPLEAGILEDPETLPPRFRQGLVALPGSELLADGTLRLDLDGDGKAETPARPGKPRLVKGKAGKGPVLLDYRRVTKTWEVTAAGVLRSRAGPRTVEVLDRNGDGEFRPPDDLVRWAGGAFQPLATTQRLASPSEIVAFSLRREGEAWFAEVRPEAKPADVREDEWRGLLAVSSFRNGVGLAPVSLDRARCDGCRKHAEYIRLNPTDGFGHEEKPGRPGYSEEGRTAAARGVMERTSDPAHAVARLTRMMLHRTPFLGEASVPLGVGTTSAGPAARGDAWGLGTGFTVLWGAQALVDEKSFPVVVPGPGARDVARTLLQETPEPESPLAFYGSPRGFAVSVSFLPEGKSGESLALYDAESGRALSGETWSPTRPIHSSFAHNYRTVYFAPRAPLEAQTAYVAVFRMSPDEPPLTWSFRTGR